MRPGVGDAIDDHQCAHVEFYAWALCVSAEKRILLAEVVEEAGAPVSPVALGCEVECLRLDHGVELGEGVVECLHSLPGIHRCGFCRICWTISKESKSESFEKSLTNCHEVGGYKSSNYRWGIRVTGEGCSVYHDILLFGISLHVSF